MRRFAFRVNGNKDIGMGHLMRCLYLTKHLNGSSLFLINANGVMADKVKEFGHRCHVIPSVTDQDFAVMVETLESYPERIQSAQPSEAAELKELVKLIQDEKIDVLVTDLLAPSTAYLQALKETGVLLVSLDEVGQITFPSDLLFNCNAVSKTRNYITKNGTRVFTGQQYALLKDEFSAVEPIPVRQTVQKILVTCGGTDMKGLSLKILEALKSFSQEIEIVLVQGLEFKFRAELEKLLESMETVTVLKNVKDMRDLMRSVDIAIASGGTTMYELAALGVPTIILDQYRHQDEFASELARQDALINLGLGKDVTTSAIKTAVVELLPFQKRQEMSKAARKVIDGQGAKRVAKIIQECVA